MSSVLAPDDPRVDPAGRERSPEPRTSSPSPADSSRDAAHEDFLFRLYRGSELLQENRIVEAKEELELALAMQPLDPKAQDLLGAVYFRLGAYPAAIPLYEGLSGRFPRDVALQTNLALCYLQTAQPELARRILANALRIDPDHRRVWGYLGLALQRLGEFEQAHAAFERGGQAMMAERLAERRLRSARPLPSQAPLAGAGSSHAGGGECGGGGGSRGGVGEGAVVAGAGATNPETGGPAPVIEHELRAMAEAAFAELDAGGLEFVLAEPQPSGGSDGPWHTLELGDASRRKSPYATSVPPAGVVAPAGPGVRPTRVTLPSLAPVTSVVARADPAPAGRNRPASPPPLLVTSPEATVTLHPTGVLLVRVDEGHEFGGRLESFRVIAGRAATRVLHRRARDADTSEVLGGIGSPLVRVEGRAQLILGARSPREIALLSLDDETATVREDALLGFELCLAYESGRIAPEGEPTSGRGAGDGPPIVQLRGRGVVALELAGKLAGVPQTAGAPMLVRRDWLVGWLGRLSARAWPANESPNGQRGLVGISGDGVVLVCAG